MFVHNLCYFDQQVITIHPGEYYASSEDVIISTVLGSCVSVAFYDSVLKQGGINHFMLPGNIDNEDVMRSHNAKYGMFAIELLFNELMKMGSQKKNITAKVFGGGSVLRLENQSHHVPEGNIAFALAYLKTENIPIVSNDTGGILPRKIFFFAKTGKVLLKRISSKVSPTVEKEEAEYLGTIQKQDSGDVTLF